MEMMRHNEVAAAAMNHDTSQWSLLGQAFPLEESPLGPGTEKKAFAYNMVVWLDSASEADSRWFLLARCCWRTSTVLNGGGIGNGRQKWFSGIAF